MKTTLRLLGLLLALIPLGPQAWAQCITTSTLNYTTANLGNRKTATETVRGTSFTFGGYTSSVPGLQTNTFSVGTDGALTGRSLVWQLDNTGNSGTNESSVTLTFTRPVNNLALQLQDIDADVNFVDNLAFEAYTSGSTMAAQLTSDNFLREPTTPTWGMGKCRARQPARPVQPAAT
ncbi:hypothetical protein [Hymenobacter cavernae]|uniref:Uncharacterized protein n=1 Tax=Hymenobacter cavernae TaxID=2044852 RepID=A0ABQ1TL14_9BACT|nr:hypothetical protein [Hymenobacter cavernae]GGE98009.1 hypothetical protein GCM10011383_05980 [Hymenobacter cavernae]